MYLFSSFGAKCYSSDESESGFRNESGWQFCAVFSAQPGGKQDWVSGYRHWENPWRVMPSYCLAEEFGPGLNFFDSAHPNCEDDGAETNETDNGCNALLKEFNLGSRRTQGNWKNYRNTQHKLRKVDLLMPQAVLAETGSDSPTPTRRQERSTANMARKSSKQVKSSRPKMALVKCPMSNTPVPANYAEKREAYRCTKCGELGHPATKTK